MKKLVDMIADSHDLGDDAQDMLVRQFRDNPLFIAFLKTLTNTANEAVRGMENIDLTTQEGVNQAIAAQGYCKGIRTLIHTLCTWDDAVVEKVLMEKIQQMEKGIEDAS